MKKNILPGVAAAVLATTLAMPAFSKNLATVNGKPVPQERMMAFKAQLEKSGRPITPEIEKQIKEELIAREVYVQEALKEKLDKTKEYQDQMELARQSILINELLMKFDKSSSVTDADIKAEYDKFAAANSGKEYKASHILVEKEEDANKIIERLKKDEKFEDIAKSESKDPGSGSRGGDLGWTNPASFVPEFSDAMKALSPGEMTQKPVKSQFGWHIIRLEEVRDAKLPPMEQLKPQIEQSLKRQKQAEYLDSLRKKAKVVETEAAPEPQKKADEQPKN